MTLPIAPSRFLSRLLIWLYVAYLGSSELLAQETPSAFEVNPQTVRLSGAGAEFSLLVDGIAKDGRRSDLTQRATYRSSNPSIARVDDKGVIRAIANGITQVIVTVSGRKKTVGVVVAETERPRLLHFENDLVPIFSRYGCNSSGCHGKAEGQNGFKLSVFGFDPAADYSALIKEGRGRRLFFGSPKHSLLLLKATGAMAHGGGSRLEIGSRDYETIRQWIAAGAPVGEPDAPRVTSIRVEPAERVMQMTTRQKLRVVATRSDGRQFDVTRLARFQSNNDGLAVVDADGVVTTGQAPGQAAVMASYAGAVDVFRILMPRAETIADYPEAPHNNFIDKNVFQHLKKLNIVPSEIAADAEFLRRVYLDVIGTLPTPKESRQFLADKRKNRRALLIDQLLERPEFADYWALKWADLLRVDREALGHKRAFAFYRWIHTNITNNTPFDKTVHELLTAEGPLDDTGPANFYKVVGRPGDRASSLAQVFLGVRIACAECHDHPYERWRPTDYYRMQAFFAPLPIAKTARGELLFASGSPQTKHPRTKAVVYSHPLGKKMPEADPSGDRRMVLAKWMTAPDNPWFAQNLANRMWAHFLGRGIIDPVDDVRSTNPPSNPELLQALAKHVVDTKFDVKQLIRTITNSRVYQLSSKPNATNVKDEMNYSRALFRRLDAEVLLDMVSQTTGIGETFQGMPRGFRAIQLWDNKTSHDFLKLFGRPVRISACECERNVEASVAQVLHFLNSKKFQSKLEHEGGTIAAMVRQFTENTELIDELYLRFYSRYPTTEEKRRAADFLSRNQNRRQAAEDLAWSMLNSMEFVFNH